MYTMCESVTWSIISSSHAHLAAALVAAAAAAAPIFMRFAAGAAEPFSSLKPVPAAVGKVPEAEAEALRLSVLRPGGFGGGGGRGPCADVAPACAMGIEEGSSEAAWEGAWEPLPCLGRGGGGGRASCWDSVAFPLPLPAALGLSTKTGSMVGEGPEVGGALRGGKSWLRLLDRLRLRSVLPGAPGVRTRCAFDGRVG